MIEEAAYFLDKDSPHQENGEDLLIGKSVLDLEDRRSFQDST